MTMRFPTELISAESGEDVWLQFADTGSPLVLTGCRELLPFFRTILTEWPHEVRTAPDPAQPTPFLFIEKSNLKYVMHSQFMDASKTFSDPVDLVCAVIVEIAWETLRHNPEWLCLHCAAIEKDSRLIVFPNTRRAGKSTMTTALGLRGMNIFTDDFMALDVGKDGHVAGMASGIAPRMRLPWPASVSEPLRNRLISSEVVRSARYSYHATLENMPVKRGRRRPIGAFVILDRAENCEAEFLPASRAEALRATITQNFSRAGNAGRILQMLYYLACNLPTLRLRYSDTEAAAALVDDYFSKSPLALPKEPAPETDPANYKTPDLQNRKNGAPLPSNGKLVRAGGVIEYLLDDTHFLADEEGYGIFRLDPLSGAAWNLLQTPASLEEMIDIFQHAFPEQAPDVISHDIQMLLRDMFRNRLIEVA
jgi:hypothetical protein